MLARLRFAKSVLPALHKEICGNACGSQIAAQWLPVSSVFASDASSVRHAATKVTSAPSTDFFQKYMDVDTMVRQSFVEVQKRYQKFFEAQSDIEIPLDGNQEKIKKYHNQLTKLRKQCEIPDKVEVMEMLMNEKKTCAKGSVRKWVKDLESVWGEGLFESMMGIVSEVENETGTPLIFPTEENSEPVGWPLFDKKHQALMKEYGLEKPMTKEEILFENTQRELDMIVEHAQQAMDDACEKMGIEEKFDARKIRTTLTRSIK